MVNMCVRAYKIREEMHESPSVLYLTMSGESYLVADSRKAGNLHEYMSPQQEVCIRESGKRILTLLASPQEEKSEKGDSNPKGCKLSQGC